MRAFMTLAKSAVEMLRGKREISFYFSTLTLADSLLALCYGLLVLAGLPVARGGRERFTRLVAQMFGTKEIHLYGSARSALYAHLKSLGLEPGAEVIVTGFTCEVVPNAVINAGLTPVYADIDPESYCMTAGSAAKVVSERTRVLIVQHTFGVAAELEPLLDLARRHGLYVIEDCAVSLGSFYRDRLTGTFGDAAIFSFELSKTITSCWGGMLLVNSGERDGGRKQREFYRQVPAQHPVQSGRLLMQLGLSGLLSRPVLCNLGKYASSFFYASGFFRRSTSPEELDGKLPAGYLHSLSDPQAVLLLRQLKRLERITGHSCGVAKYYQEELAALPGITPYRSPEGARYNLIRYPLRCGDRDQWGPEFQRASIDLGLWFTAPLSSPEVDHPLFGYRQGDCPNAEEVAATICNLPTNLRVTEKDRAGIVRLCSAAAGRAAVRRQ